MSWTADSNTPWAQSRWCPFFYIAGIFTVRAWMHAVFLVMSSSCEPMNCSPLILKDDAVTVLHSICQQIGKTQQWPQHWKRSVFIPIPKKGNAKECSNYCTIVLISLTSKVMLKIPQARLQQYVNNELLDVQAGFRKGRGTWDQIANIRWIVKKAKELHKNIYFCLLTMPKPLTVWITINCGKLKRWEYQTTWPAPWEICIQVRK